MGSEEQEVLLLNLYVSATPAAPVHLTAWWHVNACRQKSHAARCRAPFCLLPHSQHLGFPLGSALFQTEQQEMNDKELSSWRRIKSTQVCSFVVPWHLHAMLWTLLAASRAGLAMLLGSCPGFAVEAFTSIIEHMTQMIWSKRRDKDIKK